MKTAHELPASADSFAVERRSGSIVVPRQILVVDDDADIRGIIEKILVRAGYHVTTAEDGENGWELFCRGNFDLLITDHDMPNVTGLVLTRLVRSRQPELPVILISGKMPWDEVDTSTLLKPGVALEKPFSIVELVTHVQGLLAGPGHEDAPPKSRKLQRPSMVPA